MRVRPFLFALFALVALAPSVVMADDAAHAEGAGVPQLDTTYYASQFFWLVVTGVCLYVLMAKVALPRVARMIDTRDSMVRDDLMKANKFKQEAEDLKIAYSRALRDADEKSKTLIDKTTRELADKQKQSLADAAVRINQTIAEAEKNLTGQKDALTTEVAAMSDRLSKAVVIELAKGRAA